jgi:hypothetical protein
MSEAEDDSAQNPKLVTLTVRDINSLAERLENRAKSVVFRDQPEVCNDMTTAARLCRHVVRVGWVITSVAIA